MGMASFKCYGTCNSYPGEMYPIWNFPKHTTNVWSSVRLIMVVLLSLKVEWYHYSKILSSPLNPLTLGALCQKCIFGFSGWIWTKLVPIYSKKHLQDNSLKFFPLELHLKTFLLRQMQWSKFWDSGQESDLHLLRSFIFFLFFFVFDFPFPPFLIFLLQWLTFFCACFQFKNVWESILKTGNFYYGVATCSPRKLLPEFSTQNFEHFCAYFSLYWADHSDQGIIG